MSPNSPHRSFIRNQERSPEWKDHFEAVESIQNAIRQYHQKGQSFRISHGSTNSTRNPASKGTRLIDTSKLRRVLEVDQLNKTVTVEPNVSMDRLVEATLPYGLIPPVVMEFPGITAGGGYNGTSGESSSFRHGFFDQSVTRAEIILANGDKVEASRSEFGDLLEGAAGAVGTLGTTTLLEIQLLEAQKYVLTTYHPVHSVEEAVSMIKQAIADPHIDYIDGILFSQDLGAVITGTRTDVSPENAPVQTFSAARDPWFYLHVQERVKKSKGTPIVEAVPLAEYLFRYDRGGFWVGAAAYKYFYTPFNRWTRWLLDDFMHTRMLYKAFHASGHAARFFVQDLALPFDKMREFVEFTDKKLGIYPLWLCPLRQRSLPTMHPHHGEIDPATGEGQPLLNIGVWGYGPRKRRDFIQVNRELEAKLRELGGMKWLYAQAYYTEGEFWSQFDREWYDRMREKYHAKTLPTIYEKVRVAITPDSRPSLRERLLEIWPMAGIYGLMKAIASGSYRDARASTWKHSPSRQNPPN